MVNMNKHKDPSIYALMHDGRVFYVGRTTTNPQNRLWQHIYLANVGHPSPVYEYMRAAGVRDVEVKKLESIAEGENAVEIEARWIAKLYKEGQPLTNVLGLDSIPNSWPLERRKTLGESKRGKSTWIKGKTGEEAGWTQTRKDAYGASVKKRHQEKSESSKHGSVYFFNKGCRCEECKNARARANKIQNERRIAKRKAEGKEVRGPRPHYETPLYQVHGTVACYKNGKCRCMECSNAYREYKRGLPKRE